MRYLTRVCKKPSHKHIMAKITRTRVNHYIKGTKVLRINLCK